MPRYILIDNHTGYIFGDTADLPGEHIMDGAAARDHEMTPTLAARWVDEAIIGAFGRTYIQHSYAPAGARGYHVYRADVDGSDAVPVVWDGQDSETIREVVDNCDFICFMEVIDETD